MKKIDIAIRNGFQLFSDWSQKTVRIGSFLYAKTFWFIGSVFALLSVLLSRAEGGVFFVAQCIVLSLLIGVICYLVKVFEYGPARLKNNILNFMHMIRMMLLVISIVLIPVIAKDLIHIDLSFQNVEQYRNAIAICLGLMFLCFAPVFYFISCTQKGTENKLEVL